MMDTASMPRWAVAILYPRAFRTPKHSLTESHSSISNHFSAPMLTCRLSLYLHGGGGSNVS